MSTNSFKIKNSVVLTPKDLSTLVSPEAGEIACDINDSNKIKRYDAASASWVEVGSGGVGSVDIMFVQDFESTSLSSFTQTGLSLSTTNPLHGKVSAVLTHQAAVNQSFKEVKIVDPKFRGQAIVLDLNVKSAASAGNVVIKVRDESNSADLIVSEALQLSNDVSGRRSSVSFTIPSTCSSLSYTITALPEAGSPVTRIDDIVAMLSDVSLLETSVEFQIPVVTEWTDYSMTIGASTTAPTKGVTSVDKAQWRRVGSDMEIRYDFKQTSAGSAGSGVYLFSIPSGYTIDNTKVPSGSADQAVVGVVKLSATTDAVGVTTALGQVLVSKTYLNRLALNYTQSTVENTTWVSSAAYQLSGATIGYSFSVKVPIVGWTSTETTTKTIPLTQSGLVQQADANLKMYGFSGFGSSSTAILRFTTTQESEGSSFTYNSSSVSGDSITILESGIYSITSGVKLTSTSDALQIGIAKNLTLPFTGGPGLFTQTTRLSVSGDRTNTTVANDKIVSTSWTGKLNANDIVYISSGQGGLADAWLTVSKQGSLKQVSVSSDQKITIPTSELRFEGASSRGSTATAIVKFDTMAKLRGDAFTVESDAVLGTRITMKKAGKLDVSSSIYSTVAGQQLSITKNSSTLVPATVFNVASELLSTEYTTGTADVLNVSYSGYVSVGDIIRIAANVAMVANPSNNLNLSFQEQDISVSVTNTLPQFSDSDSSVRLDTANGYGSTANKIRRFSNVRDNIGADIEYLDSAADGARFVVKSAGVYNISYTEQASSAAFFGLSKNSSQLTTSIISITTADRLAIGTTDSISGYPETIAWQGYLQAGDVVRAHTEGALGPAGPERTQFTISKVGKPNVTGVDVTPFVNLDLSNKTTIYSASISAAGAVSNENETFISSCSVASNQFTINFKPGVFTVAPNCAITPLDGAANGNMVMILSQSASSIVYRTVRHDSVALATGVNIIVQKQGVDYDPSYEAILTPTETFSTDTASLSYASSAAYTLSTLQNAPVGTYITFTYAANTNTRTQTTTRPTQTDADMNANGIQIFTRAYNAPSTAGNPAVIAIQIGKGLKGKSLDLYKSAGKVNAGTTDFVVRNTANQSGLYFQDYNEVTGILILDSGNCALNTIAASEFNFTDVSSQTSGYLVINASKNPALTGIGLNRVAARAISTAGTSYNNGPNTYVYGTKDYDTHNAFNANTYTIPENGYYLITAKCRIGGLVQTSQECRLFARKNSSTLYSLSGITGNGANINFQICGSIVLNLIKGDTIDIRISTNTAGNLNESSTANDNVFEIIKVSV
jgi:hypothetical protein